MHRIFPLLLLALAVGCQAGKDAPSETPETEGIAFDPDGTLSFTRDGQTLLTIDIEIADTDSTRTRGLMARSSLPPKSGMLFIFDRAEPQSFWMANTPLSLDIFFVDADSEIVNIAKYTRPLSPQQVSSIGAARYVVETQAGVADSYGITETDHVSWLRKEQP